MSEPLTIERFRVLADAYGGVIARWPADVVGDAFGLSQTGEGGAILTEALALDQTLDLWRVAVPAAALQARIVASATQPSVVRSAKLWWSAFGLATALSGATAGVAATLFIAPANHVDSMTVFGDLPAGSDDHG